MKKILLAAALSLGVSGSAFADACTNFLGNVFTPSQEIKLCAYNGNWISQTGYELVNGTGTNQATAAPLSATKRMHQIFGANGVVGWLLPVANSFTIGSVHTILSTSAAVPNIYPTTGQTINGQAANAVWAGPNNVQVVICTQTTATAWVCA